MVNVIKILAGMVNNLHDSLINLFKAFGYNISDKQMHFIVIGIIGITIFFIADALFKICAEYSVSIISFIYTFTVLVVIVFAIEIEQKITGRGRMEFADVAAGLWGFFEFFSVYLLIRIIVHYCVKVYKRKKGNNRKQSIDD